MFLHGQTMIIVLGTWKTIFIGGQERLLTILSLLFWQWYWES